MLDDPTQPGFSFSEWSLFWGDTLPETNSSHLARRTSHKEAGSSSNPRVFHELCWFQGGIFLRFSESVVDLNSIFPKLGLFVEPHFLGVVFFPLGWGSPLDFLRRILGGIFLRFFRSRGTTNSLSL